MHFRSYRATLFAVILASCATAQSTLPDPAEDTCLVNNFADRIGLRAEDIDVEGNRMTRLYSVIRSNKFDTMSDDRDDIIHMILDENEVVRRMTCKVDFPIHPDNYWRQS